MDAGHPVYKFSWTNMAEVKQTQASQALLIGQEDVTIDKKGRIFVGTKTRSRLGSNFTMCLSANGSINAYPQETWNGMAQDLMSRDPGLKARQDYARFLMGTAEDELDFDEQGRVVIPVRLRKMAQIENEVKIVGCGDYIEIWAQSVYEQFVLDERCPDPNRQKRMLDSYAEMIQANRFKYGHRPGEVQINGSTNPG